MYIRNIFISIFIFLSFGFLGSLSMLQSWDSVVYFYPQSSGLRYPAAIQRNYDFSNLQGMALNRAAKERLLLDAKIYKEDTRLGVELGHFVQKNSEGYKELACHTYNQIELTFEANNMATSGHRPIMKVVAPCNVSENYNRIQTIWIPTQEILNSSSMSESKQIFYGNAESATLSFKHVFTKIPMEWSLSKLRLFHENSDQEMLIKKHEVMSILQTPLTLSLLE
jgi:hypothetical protein